MAARPARRLWRYGVTALLLLAGALGAVVYAQRHPIVAAEEN
ncbi:hypothetical protein [Magnetofaba australis]|nr:hypothetical protein [Magnetofaba australis]